MSAARDALESKLRELKARLDVAQDNATKGQVAAAQLTADIANLEAALAALPE